MDNWKKRVDTEKSKDNNIFSHQIFFSFVNIMVEKSFDKLAHFEKNLQINSR